MSHGSEPGLEDKGNPKLSLNPPKPLSTEASEPTGPSKPLNLNPLNPLDTRNPLDSKPCKAPEALQRHPELSKPSLAALKPL